ncbi:MAG TPA: EAL domain-containing protein [Acidimicrobiales bacterium]|nr:EAL domain-containing protein [Acidimicrobiales bacterium]
MESDRGGLGGLPAFREAFLHALERRSRDLSLVVDGTGTILFVSAAVEGIFGYAPDEVVNTDGWGFVHPDDVEAVQQVFAGVVENGGAATAEFRVRARDGSWRWVEEVMTNLLHTPIGGIVCNLLDVTERRHVRDLLRLEQARNRAIVETVQEGLWLVDDAGRTVFANRQMSQIFGVAPEDLGSGGGASLLVEQHSAVMNTRTAARGSRGRHEYDVAYQHPDGSTRQLHVVVVPMSFGDGDEVRHGMLRSVVDVTHVRRMEEELRNAALRDPLTGLPNRTLLVELVQQMLGHSSRSGADDLWVMHVDLDQFKLLNASLGHDLGDEVLCEAAARLSSAAPPDAAVARVGSDEFVVAWLARASVEPSPIAESVLSRLGEVMEIGGQAVRVSASIGVAGSPASSADELLGRADSAMHAAKSAGRGRFRLFDERLVAEAREAYRIVNDLVGAFDDGSLSIAYQPIVDLGSGLVVGFEALARWVHPELGRIPPSRFVPLAEAAGLSRQLDRWVVTRTLSEFSRARAEETVDKRAYVSINLSAQELGNPDVGPFLLDAVARSGIPAANVVFEITEGAIMYDQRESIRLLESLRMAGFGVSLDDFGTGQSSLANLRKLPVSVIKIDRAFVDDMSFDCDALAIVTSVVNMASAIGLPVVAEGVESEAQAAQLARLGCTAGQGWLWSHPVAVSDLAALPRHFRLASAAERRTPHRAGPPQRIDDRCFARMVELQTEGASLATIAAALNSEGSRTPAGRRWHSISVARALAGMEAS